jgi:hypothetical protein
MESIRFGKYVPPKDDRTPFEKLLPIFLEILTHTSGDVDEALDWMQEVDKEHGLFSAEYTFENFKGRSLQAGHPRCAHRRRPHGTYRQG